jgi:proteasome lid subunit RPN8/RPN11
MPGSQLLMSVWDYDLFGNQNVIAMDDEYLDDQEWGEETMLLWNGDEHFSSRSVKESVIPDLDSANRDEDAACCRRSSRNHEAKSRAVTARALYHQMCRFDCDPYLLITPFCFGAAGGVAASLSQPFRVLVHPQCPLICEVHSHMSESEVIGLLAGKWNSETRTLYVQAPFPCISTSTIENNGSTDVEMDPEAEYKARQQAEQMGLQILGWYHSHPRFKPNPSVIDIFNQQQYQSVMKDQPFLGLIISPYDKDSKDSSALHQWFVVKRYDEDVSSGEVHMPVKVDIDVQGYTKVSHPQFISADQLEQTLRHLAPLTDVIASAQSITIGDVTTTETEDASPNDEQPKKKKQKQQTTSSSSSASVDESALKDISLKDLIPVAARVSAVVPSPIPILSAVDSDEQLGRRSGRAKKPSEALLLMVEQKDHVFNERITPKTAKVNKVDQSGKPAPAAKGVSSKKEQASSKSTNKTKKDKPEPTLPVKEERPMNVPAKKEQVGKKRKNAASIASESDPASVQSLVSYPAVEPAVEDGPSIYSNLILSLLHTSPSATQGQALLLNTPFTLRLVARICLGLGFYYGRFKHRAELMSPWKGKRKIDKIKDTLVYWLSFFEPPQPHELGGTDATVLERFAERVVAFFIECWSDYSSVTGKLRKVSKKTDAPTLQV